MSLSHNLANHFREVHFAGNNWTVTNLKDLLADVTWEQATTKVESLNTIAVLVFHMNYYVDAVIKVLEGGPLDAHDKYSFDLPPIENKEDWDRLVNKAISDAEKMASLVEQLPEEKLPEMFVDEKYGTYYRNLHGIIEHTYYHLGQVSLIKKLVQSSVSKDTK